MVKAGSRIAAMLWCSASLIAATSAHCDDEIRIVGSSTVYPFSAKVAQEFQNKSGLRVVVEATGSGGGHQQFCQGKGAPHIVNSSRRQKPNERSLCARNGVGDIVEAKIGADGIVIANARSGMVLDFVSKDIYLAFAAKTPVSDEDCTLTANPYEKWSDIRPDLPDTRIETYGPPPTSGTRDAFVEIAMENGAMQIACLRRMSAQNRPAFLATAHRLREDGAWIDAGENDNAIVQVLARNANAVGVFGYAFLDQNAERVKAAAVDGAAPSIDTIADGAYPISRSLFFYMKADSARDVAGLRDYALEFLSEEASGFGGYLEETGLIPMDDDERLSYRAAVEALTPVRYRAAE
ncbi:MAG: substrate-binding domain-containing protein [Pseudomonadota bacterium]